MQDLASRGSTPAPEGASSTSELSHISHTSGAPGERRGGIVSRRTSRLLTMVSVCFVFGGLLAVQLRAMQTVRSSRAETKQNVVQAEKQSQLLRQKMIAEEKKRSQFETQVNVLTAKLKATGSLSQAQILKLSTQIKEMQGLAGLTEVRGQGVRMTITDSPIAREFQDPSGFGPGMVHDFDLQGIVNELRAAKAEAIAIRGAGGPLIRVTGYTPIRCVGPVIQINYEAVATPFVIEAIGEVGTLESVLNMPDGIVDNLRAPKNQVAPPMPIKIERRDELVLPAGENVPKFRVGKVVG